MGNTVGNVPNNITLNPVKVTLNTNYNAGYNLNINSGVKIVTIPSGKTVSGGNTVDRPGFQVTGNGGKVIVLQSGNVVGGPGQTRNTTTYAQGGTGAPAYSSSNVKTRVINIKGNITGGGGGGGSPGTGGQPGNVTTHSYFNQFKQIVAGSWTISNPYVTIVSPNPYDFKNVWPVGGPNTGWQSVINLRHGWDGALKTLQMSENSYTYGAFGFITDYTVISNGSAGSDGNSGTVGSPGQSGGQGNIGEVASQPIENKAIYNQNVQLNPGTGPYMPDMNKIAGQFWTTFNTNVNIIERDEIGIAIGKDVTDVQDGTEIGVMGYRFHRRHNCNPTTYVIGTERLPRYITDGTKFFYFYGNSNNEFYKSYSNSYVRNTGNTPNVGGPGGNPGPLTSGNITTPFGS